MSASTSSMVFNAEQISPRVWRVVEDDPYRQYAFLYVVLGDDKCILIDTGTGVLKIGVSKNGILTLGLKAHTITEDLLRAKLM